MSVPSNLIPTRVTQLPVAPVADENSLMMIVYQGNNYQIRVGDLLSVAGVPVTRQVIAGTSLQGGGQLSSNVTLSVAPGGIGTAQLANSGVTPGIYGTATNIPVFTVDATGRVVAATTIPATISGYVPESRQVIAGTGLTGGGALNTDVTLNANLSNATPQAGFQSGSAGVSTSISRADHKHPAVDLSDDDQVDNLLGMGNGGTGRSLVPNSGGVVWSGADGLYIGPAGVYGQVLASGGINSYFWATVDVDIPRPANTVRAGPVSGPDADPTFRYLVNADIPAALDGKTLTNVAVNSGNINNTAIGSTTPSVGTFTTVAAATGNITDVNATTVDSTNLEVTNLKAKDGTAAGSVANSTGVVTLNSAVLTTADINGGTVDGTVVGGSAPAAGTFTTLGGTTITASVQFTGPGTGLSGTASSLSIGGAAGSATTATNVANGAANQLVYNTGSSTTSFVAAPTVANTFLEWSGSAFQWSANPLGTVTSVGLSLPSEFNVTNSPVTSSGTLTGNWASQSANYIFAAPNGSSGTPTFRAMVAADVPTLNQNTTGSAGSVVNAVTFNSTGGAAPNSTFNGSSLLTVDYSTVGAPKADGTGASGTWGINISGNAATATSATSATSATTATNIAGGAAGSIPYQTGAGTTALLATSSGVLVGGTTPSYSTAPTLTGTNFTGIPNAALSNSSITLGTTSVSLGGTATTLGGLTSVAVTQDPTTALQVATKQYVDTIAATSITYHTPVKYEVPSTTGNLNAIYNNGAAGVGATLTNNGTLAAFAPDGPTASPGDRILIYNQTNAFENGVYTVTTVGDGSTAWVLTRATDANSYGLKNPNALGEGDAFFVTSGNTGAGETYVCNTSGVITFGTTAITFVQVSSAQIYSAGTGLTLSGTQFSLSTPVSAANGGSGLSSYTTGDLLYASGTTTLSKLGIGATNRILTSSGSAPQWTDPSTVTVGSATTATSAASATTATTATNVAGGAANRILYNTGAGATSFVTAPITSSTYLKWDGAAFVWDTAGTGTVTSVGMTVPTGLSVSGTPVTGSGTFAVTFQAGYSIPTTASQSNWDTAYTDRLKWDGGATGLNAGTGRTSLGGTTVGQNLFTLTNPSAVTFPRFNADNTVSALDAATFRTAIGAGTGNGTVTSIVAGSFLTGGTITTTGTIAVDATSANTASKVVARDASGNFSAGTITATLSGSATSATTAAKTSATTVPASTAFSKWLFATTSTAGTLDWNDSTNTIPGVGTTLLLGSATNGPGGGSYYHPFNIEYAGIDGTGNVTQMAVAYGSPGNQLYMRGRYLGTWSGWVQFLNSGNYNSYSPTLTGGGASGTWGINISGNAATATSATSATTATTATNLAGGAASQIPYQTGSGATTFLANGTAGQVLKSNGASAPSWSNLDGGTF